MDAPQLSLTELIERELGAGQLELPVFSATALSLQKKLDDPDVDIDTIADLIRQDPALASRTLTMANSAFYGGLEKVETISRAIVRLGTEKILNLAMAAAAAVAMQSSQPLLRDFLQRLWVRSFVSAQACRWIAETSGEAARAETAFLAGLLHDLGELFLLRVLEQLEHDGLIQYHLTPELVEEVLVTLHPRMGEALMLAWGLPQVYADVAREHAQEQDELKDSLLATVRLSDLALSKAGIGQDADPNLVLAATDEARLLGLNEIQLAQFEVLLDDAAELARTMAVGVA